MSPKFLRVVLLLDLLSSDTKKKHSRRAFQFILPRPLVQVAAQLLH